MAEVLRSEHQAYDKAGPEELRQSSRPMADLVDHAGGAEKSGAAILIERARTLANKVAAHAEEIDASDRLPDWLVAELRASGLVETLVPQCYGGHELGLDTMIEIVLPFAAACPSVGWVVAFYIGHNWLHCLVPEKMQRELYADTRCVLSAGAMTPLFKLRPVEGGYIANGRGPWASGLPHADWSMNAGFVEGREAAGPVTFFVPRQDYRLVENWSVTAMRATGSHDVAVEEKFVPEHRIISTMEMMRGGTPGSKLHSNRMYALPVWPVTLCYVLPVLVGALRGAADAYVGLAKKRTLNFVNMSAANQSAALAGSQSALMRVGRGQAAASLAEGMLRDFVARVIEPDAPMEPKHRIAFRTQAALIGEFCQSTINKLMSGAGASAFRENSPLQRYFRDVNMLANHAALDTEPATEAYGKVVQGLPFEGIV